MYSFPICNLLRTAVYFLLECENVWNKAYFPRSAATYWSLVWVCLLFFKMFFVSFKCRDKLRGPHKNTLKYYRSRKLVATHVWILYFLTIYKFIDTFYYCTMFDTIEEIHWPTNSPGISTTGYRTWHVGLLKKTESHSTKLHNHMQIGSELIYYVQCCMWDNLRCLTNTDIIA